jgi:2-C-methyl-D-erythritol 4-phosphate cytidylyltransferase / 2-C-methyl-D-erythritol 2,4-cyclodiphosphate synthase
VVNLSRYFVVIPAAGVGSRVGGAAPKQYLPLDGRPMILHTIDALVRIEKVSHIYVLLSPEDDHWDQISGDSPKRVTVIRCGGETRAATVRNGLVAIADKTNESDWILVHDAARPCIEPRSVEAMMDVLRDDPVGGLRALPIPDTVKRGENDQVVETIPRDNLWLAQTPQMFRYGLLCNALSRASDESYTDEAQAVEALGLSPRLVAGNSSNFKVTFPEDIAIAEAILGDRRRTKEATLRVGQGFDVHAFAEGRKLIIGGVEIPYERGLLGHSDADVLLHAICDALLGAAALGDIGKHFPDTDPRYKGADSRVLLRHVAALIRERGFKVHNVDATIIAQAPRMASHIPSMAANIAADLEVAVDSVNVKATTTEKLGFTGRGEGIAAQAICLLGGNG